MFLKIWTSQDQTTSDFFVIAYHAESKIIISFLEAKLLHSNTIARPLAVIIRRYKTVLKSTYQSHGNIIK